MVIRIKIPEGNNKRLKQKITHKAKVLLKNALIEARVLNALDIQFYLLLLVNLCLLY